MCARDSPAVVAGVGLGDTLGSFSSRKLPLHPNALLSTSVQMAGGGLTMLVFGMETEGNILRAVQGERIGTLVTAG